MCGIVGAIGHPDAASVLYQALQRLEYRGYDSAGICIADGGALDARRAVGKLSALGEVLAKDPLPGMTGIGHTRWATHGKATLNNAHPIMAGAEVAVVHNGIIENHKILKAGLIERGHVFTSDTDTEVLTHLFAEAVASQPDLMSATKHVLGQIEGAYAFAVVAKAFPDQIAIARNASPLAVGLGEGANYIGSDAMAMGSMTRRIIFLKDGDYGVISRDDIELRSEDGTPAQREVVMASASPGLVSKDGYQHFMEKEIHEQPEAIAHTLAEITAADGGFNFELGDAAEMKGMVMLAAGTSHNAAMIGKYWMESLADLPVVTEIASEFRYRNPSVRHLDMAMGISQSGESLDTLMALRYAAEQGLKTLGLVNVAESTIARETDLQLLTRAGPEIGVASTKSFTAQLAVLLGLAAELGQKRGVLSADDAAKIHADLASLPRLMGAAMNSFDDIRPFISQLARAQSCLFLGRGMLYPLALEGALKLKELSYIHAEGYASGEMKHGPIALIEEGLPVIALLSNDEHLPKAVSNLMEAKARGAAVMVICTESTKEAVEDIDTIITVPDCDPLIAPILLSIPAQILSYLTAVHKGTDVDQPRNHAKSVTLE
ncbi:MAG: glutamine--fructose-6-phosphate transaminase (isomerizing) [Alphaproteobacteria bacterium]|nr:glutamine--fructose-6-phosphate transaminase (isomerizing) [Alphaproteobacteria bacterium]